MAGMKRAEGRLPLETALCRCFKTRTRRNSRAGAAGTARRYSVSTLMISPT